MGREFTYTNMARMPRLNGSAATALAKGVLSAAEAVKGEGLPLIIERPRGRLQTVTAALKAELEPENGLDSGVAVAADREEDRAWGSFSDWVEAMTGMQPGAYPELDEMQTLKSTLFGEGLRFLALSFREEWTQSETRLNIVADKGFEATINKLGGAPFLLALRNAHARYGDVLGITSPMKVEDSPEIKEKLAAVIDALRAYVVKVMAYADPEEPGSEALAETLLRPITQWRKTPSRPMGAGAADEPSAD